MKKPIRSSDRGRRNKRLDRLIRGTNAHAFRVLDLRKKRFVGLDFQFKKAQRATMQTFGRASNLFNEPRALATGSCKNFCKLLIEPAAYASGSLKSSCSFGNFGAFSKTLCDIFSFLRPRCWFFFRRARKTLQRKTSPMFRHRMFRHKVLRRRTFRWQKFRRQALILPRSHATLRQKSVRKSCFQKAICRCNFHLHLFASPKTTRASRRYKRK